jgi:glyceraldehyde-3-phosphate dehydrogenase (NADP+)
MKMLIGGKWLGTTETIEVRDPWDDSLVDTVPSGTAEHVRAALDAAEKSRKAARQMPAHQRATILFAAADYVRQRQEEFARTIAREGSKTIREARKEARRCVNTLTVSAEEATRLLGETVTFDAMPGSEKRRGYFFRFPIGIIAAITPFNDPLNLVAHKLGPAVAAGNTVVLKPATVTPLSALKLGEAFAAAGLPPGMLNIVTGRGGVIGDPLVADPRVRMVSFTGGVEAGRAVAARSGLKKLGMELGSNTPVIVLDDCRLDNAVECSVSGAFWAAGQNCIGVQRIYVQEGIYDAFAARFVELTQRYKVGPKLDEDCDMGPMIEEREARRIEDWVAEALAAGARLLCGHQRRGAVYAPTVLADVPEDARVAREEVFAPVVSLFRVRTLDEAIEKANAVDFGLHAGIFTENLNSAYRAIEELEVGGVMVNDSSDYRVDAMPFGGVKNSGLGREGIRFALQEMTEPRVVCFNL